MGQSERYMTDMWGQNHYLETICRTSVIHKSIWSIDSVLQDEDDITIKHQQVPLLINNAIFYSLLNQNWSCDLRCSTFLVCHGDI